MTHHAGRLFIPGKIILKWLQFEGGRIHYLGHSDDRLDYVIVIEHPDMPEVLDGQEVPIIAPAYYWEDIYRVEPRIHTFYGKIKHSIKWIWKIWKS